MTDMEKLARDICWAGFNYPPPGGKIKYWARITPNARASYVQTAKEFLFYAGKLAAQKQPIEAQGVRITIERAA